MKHFALQLPTAARDALVERLHAAGVTPEPVEDGLLIHDPAKNAVLLRTPHQH